MTVPEKPRSPAQKYRLTDYANDESFYCRPLRLSAGKTPERMPVPVEAGTVRVAFLPPMSGLEATETRLDEGAVNVRVGEGRTAEVLRNLCLRIRDENEAVWNRMAGQIAGLFGSEIRPPRHIAERGEIAMSYREQGVELDFSSAAGVFSRPCFFSRTCTRIREPSCSSTNRTLTSKSFASARSTACSPRRPGKAAARSSLPATPKCSSTRLRAGISWWPSSAGPPHRRPRQPGAEGAQGDRVRTVLPGGADRLGALSRGRAGCGERRARGGPATAVPGVGSPGMRAPRPRGTRSVTPVNRPARSRG